MVLAIVAVLVAVFFVATGRGGELSQEHVDYAPLELGSVSAADIAMVRPPTAMWGYNVDVTDEALDRIARVVRDRDLEIAYLQQQLAGQEMTSASSAPGHMAPATWPEPGALHEPAALSEPQVLPELHARPEPPTLAEPQALLEPEVPPEWPTVAERQARSEPQARPEWPTLAERQDLARTPGPARTAGPARMADRGRTQARPERPGPCPNRRPGPAQRTNAPTRSRAGE